MTDEKQLIERLLGKKYSDNLTKRYGPARVALGTDDEFLYKYFLHERMTLKIRKASGLILEVKKED